jgi:HemK-related putative methylase
MEIYPISEDSIFFAEFIKKEIAKIKNRMNLKYLDMGAGSGILAETTFKMGIKKENILCADINQLSVWFVRKKGFNCIKSDLFKNLKDKKFDLITFNAPYLPGDKYDGGKDTTGGKKGDETALSFLKQAKRHLNKNGKIFLLISSLTPFNRIKKFGVKIVDKKKLFFEELLILDV